LILTDLLRIFFIFYFTVYKNVIVAIGHRNSERYRNLGFHVLLFNYRGVGASEGTPTRDGFLVDLYTVIKYAIDEVNGLGIKPSNVIVCGRSLGGAISTVLLSKIFPEYPNIILCNTRSFSTLKAAACKLLGQIHGDRVGNGAAVGIKLLGWELNSLKGWNTLNDETNGYRWIESVGDDEILLPGAKLVDHLIHNEHRIIHLDLGGVSGHNRALTSSEYMKRSKYIREGLAWNKEKVL
jgi:alpha/beta superfamily hydrolase